MLTKFHVDASIKFPLNFMWSFGAASFVYLSTGTVQEDLNILQMDTAVGDCNLV